MAEQNRNDITRQTSGAANPQGRGSASLPTTGISVSQVTQYSGPLPPPELLAQYQAVIPGLADRLIDRFEKQSDHRMELETFTIRQDAFRANMGVICGLIVALVMIAASWDVMRHGQALAGSLLAGTTIVSLVGVFVYGSISRTAERKDRMQALTGADANQNQPPRKDNKQLKLP